jgi:hypothetical protein
MKNGIAVKLRLQLIDEPFQFSLLR